MTTLDEAIRARMTERGMTPTDLIRACQAAPGGPSDRSIWRLIAGDTDKPTQKVRRAVERALGWPEGTTGRIMQGLEVDEAEQIPPTELTRRVKLLEAQVELLRLEFDDVRRGTGQATG